MCRRAGHADVSVQLLVVYSDTEEDSYDSAEEALSEEDDLWRDFDAHSEEELARSYLSSVATLQNILHDLREKTLLLLSLSTMRRTHTYPEGEGG